MREEAAMDRDLALTLLRAVLERGQTLDDALARLPAAAAARDRANAHRLAACVLRRYGTLNAALEPYLRRAPALPVQLILCLGAAQLLLLDTPVHAAVATSVQLAHAARCSHQAGLVNAVLRKLAASPNVLAELDGPRLDTPPWLWAAWGPRARDIALAHQQEAPLDLTLKPGAAAPPGGVARPSGTWRYPSGTRVAELPGFAEGSFWVQDEAASLPARLLAVRAGEDVADLCAAPGGKTAQLAAAGANVTAVERDALRAGRLRENLARLGLASAVIEADVNVFAHPPGFDAILLDAPCSATGTIRRHPDVPHLKRPSDVTALAAAQRGLLAHAATLLRPGGRLVYAVCSLQPEEGEAVVADAAALGLAPSPVQAADLPFLPEAVTAQGHLRTDPAMGMDGFFAARFVKI